MDSGRIVSWLLLIGTISCSFSKKNTQLIVIDYRSYAEAFTPDKKLHDIAQDIRIVLNGESRLYITPYIKETWGNVVDTNGNLEEAIVKSDTSYFAFTWVNGDKQGLKYSLKNFRTEKGVVVAVDSMLKKFGFTEDRFKSFEIPWPTTSTTIKEENAKKVIMQALKKASPMHPDSLYQYYDKDLRNVDFGFSKKLDAENKSKLYRVELIFNKVDKEHSMIGVEVPKRVAYHQFLRVDERNTKQLQEIFEKAKADKALLIKD